MSFESDLIQNYRDLAASRDWTLEQMADDLEPRDRALAAELRKHAAEGGAKAEPEQEPETPERAAKPRGRRAPGKSEG